MMCRGTSPGGNHIRLVVDALRRKSRLLRLRVRVAMRRLENDVAAIGDLAAFVLQQERLASVASRHPRKRPAGAHGTLRRERRW
jgi:hypothetical protein